MGNWTALAVLTGVLPLLCSRALAQGGSELVQTLLPQSLSRMGIVLP